MATSKKKEECISTPVQLSTEWLELESDPGLFTLLLQDFGVRGVKVEEIYDVTQTFQDRVYGFVFLFQWTERRARKKSLMSDDCYVTEPSVLGNMFFAHQVVINSCATHALLSILLNCEQDSRLDLGPTLPQLKQFCQNLDPETRGYAIGNMPDLAAAHNKYAKPDVPIPTPPPSKRGAVMSSAAAFLPDTYHFVSYVPIGDRLFELDGLKEWPIDHGPWAETEAWTDLFKRVITRRLNEGEGIQFNLMALIPDPLPKLSEELKLLQSKEKELLETTYDLAHDQVIQCHHKEKLQSSSDMPRPQNGEWSNTDDLQKEIRTLLETLSHSMEDPTRDKTVSPHEEDNNVQLTHAIEAVQSNRKLLEDCKKAYLEELETRSRYRVEAERRTHDYDRFFSEYFKALASNHLLPQRMLEQKRSSTSKRGRKPTSSTGGKGKKLNHQKSKTTLTNGPSS